MGQNNDLGDHLADFSLFSGITFTFAITLTSIISADFTNNFINIWLFDIAMENPLKMEASMGKSSISMGPGYHGYVK